jgi:hypothetical protein
MLNDYPVLFFCLFVGGLLGFLVLGYLVTNNKLKPPLLQPAKVIYTLFRVAFFLLVFGVFLYAFVENSGWLPRMREVSVYVKPENWMTGEIKSCASLASRESDEIAVLLCDQSEMVFEPHVLEVRFWGSIKPDRDKEWKCSRGPASLTCKLQ